LPFLLLLFSLSACLHISNVKDSDDLSAEQGWIATRLLSNTDGILQYADFFGRCPSGGRHPA